MEKGCVVMQARRWVALGLGVFILLISLITKFAFSSTDEAGGGLLDEYEKEVVRDGKMTGHIALLEVKGTILDTEETFFGGTTYDHKMFLNMLDDAMEDNDVKGILVSVDTPGGGVLESAEIHTAITKAQEQYDKPVYISMGNTTASGGYYLAASADKIFAYPQTITGSIGVIMSTMNVSGLLDELGIEEKVYKSGEHKDIMSPTRPATEADDDILQTIVDEYYEEFVRVVAEGRDFSVEQARSLSDGRIYTGKQAVEVGLVDELGSLDDTIEQMREDIGAYQVFAYNQTYGFGSLFGVKAPRIFNNNLDQQVLEGVFDDRYPRAFYLLHHPEVTR
ncbi:signal peptide peptidase SppA [Shouchella lonarensis]|uniref:Signal peptide peptidase A. Serine peptidase. MEROPS family S49 n=1 Tax=Shouchella lonarensis TaxID=1464122 RepID=A0A1G6GID3_9BACI|nr:signal peptide peptidase SppA [Shouchella lonarensis]SDB81758.1 signal peptide peptidase A. Serine peptidase. MEROPS family S49 [Shouchella lonarensis]